ARLALRGLSRARSAPPRQTVRMALHPETRKLARHGRIRTRRPVEPMSEPPHSRQADPRKRSRRLGRPSQQASRKGQLAIHHRRCPREAQKALPLILNDSGARRLSLIIERALRLRIERPARASGNVEGVSEA